MSDRTFPAPMERPEGSSTQLPLHSNGTGPTQPDQRIQLIDVLRGFALLGILVVNWSDYGTKVLYNLITFLAEGSFYPMYSFLFGLGFALQLIRAEEGKRPFVLRYFWRSLILFVIGTIHYAFISAVDILRTYAVAALVLLLVRRLRPGMLLALAATLMLFQASPISQYLRPGHLWTRADPEYAEIESRQHQLTMIRSQARAFAVCDTIPGLTATYRERLGVRVPRLLTDLSDSATLLWWKRVSDILLMFLLGFYVGRRRILRDPARHTRLLAWVAGVGLAFGLAGNALDVYGDFFKDKGIALPESLKAWGLEYMLGNLGLTLFYVSIVTLLFTHVRSAVKLLAPLGHAGRMGLTNYLMQSFVFEVILSNTVIFGVRISGWYHLALLVAFFAVQVLYSWWWFRYFRFGPVEWAWRSLTWWRRQPMRISAPPQPLPEPAISATVQPR